MQGSNPANSSAGIWNIAVCRSICFFIIWHSRLSLIGIGRAGANLFLRWRR
nr:MAG TPA: hypothetical protein [Caudoviricetes sp.]